ncbi:ABC transporter substrate-binding protein [Paraburkholderia tropica]|uniref:Amino acid/amide ABC transporter substrate-binding protein, HAAT family n=2 Tax=Paraburkholderia TaxID=1822464 RepID=A0AAQ1JS67_9BURK|nr:MULTISPECIES: ABC transporter substrate-binding protein [Paraburkholderia]MBB2998104.1 branched-chain amino acid transport system substrate-binding protein [Paraburkholderia tropica]MBB6317127.1 branched-chain amino acid transport system substrate-binding protein [Paraburkholderia tropica]RQM48952.1 ABC transporter substrate-binding protein [Paraburkholderia bannensis]RQN39181.1 ABC transporter substrate-binding protein [Paraburkholderia tropica]SEI99796.1 amino acid/amide ABC transporter s
MPRFRTRRFSWASAVSPLSFFIPPLSLLALFALPSLAFAQIKIGLVLSLTGPAASLGIPARDTAAMLPTQIAGQQVQYIVLDDASDTTQAVQDTKKLIDEQHVDAIIGSSITPNTLAMLDVIAQGETPTISLASSAKIIEPVDDKRHWMFKTPQTDAMMAGAIAEHAAAHNVKTLAYIGQADALGDAFYAEVAKAAQAHGIRVVANERFNRTDASVTGQALRIVAAKPDAVVVGAAGTPAALPPKALKERGYTGLVYHNHGVGNRDFLRVCGADCNGTFLPASPVLVAAQLPDNRPERRLALDYIARYEARYGAGSVSAFGAYAWDAGLLLDSAIPVALKSAAPGTSAFRHALRDAIEATRGLQTTNGVVNMSTTDHLGLDARARVMVEIENGKWVWQPH